MSEEVLDAVQVNALPVELGGQGCSEGMGRREFFKTSKLCGLRYHEPDCFGCEMACLKILLGSYKKAVGCRCIAAIFFAIGFHNVDSHRM